MGIFNILDVDNVTIWNIKTGEIVGTFDNIKEVNSTEYIFEIDEETLNKYEA